MAAAIVNKNLISFFPLTLAFNYKIVVTVGGRVIALTGEVLLP